MRLASFLAISLICLSAATTYAAELDLTGEWASGGPYQASTLRGKGVFIYFIETGCPNCAKNWPRWNAMRKEHENQPILFLAVFPGNSKADAQSYIKSYKVEWPVLADPTRALEKKILAARLIPKTIGMDNTMQVVLADEKGTLQSGQWSNEKNSLATCIKGAQWKVDSAKVPEPLKPAWRAFEFGQYSLVTPVLSQALSNSTTKEAAQLIQASLQEEITRRMNDAKAKLEADQKWAAFKLYVAVSNDFPNTPEARTATSEAAKLNSDKTVTREQAAKTALDTIIRDYLGSPMPARQQQAKPLLQQLLQLYPDTEASVTANTMTPP